MSNFKIGDVVTGTDDAPYRITDKDGTFEVVTSPSDHSFAIKILTHRRYSGELGTVFYYVNPKYFTLVKKKKPMIVII